MVVEDEALIAMLVEDFLIELGFTVVAVTGTVEGGLAVATEASRTIDGAILDVNLGPESVFPIADALVERRIPFVFATGYGPQGLVPRYSKHPVIAKPFRLESLKHLLVSAFT
jgi:DNA-binding response OmpR family regulator